MAAQLEQVLSALSMGSAWEILAVLLAIAYLLLALKQRIECWYAAFASTVIYAVLFWDVSLLMESALQVYYLVMAVFGWYQWRKPGLAGEPVLQISTWSSRQHVLGVVMVLLLSAFSGWWLSAKTDAALPYLDSFTTWASVLTTYMVARKILENWLYWIVIDTVSIYLYIERGLYPTAGLFLAYIVIAVFGFLSWQRQWRASRTTAYAT